MKTSKFLIVYFFSVLLIAFACEQEELASTSNISDQTGDGAALDPVPTEPPCELNVGCPQLVSCDIADTMENPDYRYWQNLANEECMTYTVSLPCCRYPCAIPDALTDVVIQPTTLLCATVTPYYAEIESENLIVRFNEESHVDINFLTVQFSEYIEEETNLVLELSTEASVNEAGEKVFVFESYNETLSSEQVYVLDVLF